MQLARYFRKLQQLDNLIRKKSTGSQKDFARKTNMSRSMLNEYLKEMKEMGFPISYCRKRCSYYYSENIKMVNSLIEHEIDDDEKSRYQGGLCYADFIWENRTEIVSFRSPLLMD